MNLTTSPSAQWYATEAELSLQRLLPRVSGSVADPAQRAVFEQRLLRHFPDIFRLLYGLYHNQYDFFYHLERILCAAAEMYAQRPEALKALDIEREAGPLSFQGDRMVGGVCYVDLLAGTLSGVKEKIPYFKEVGLTYLHLMPLFSSPMGENDGGY